MAPRYPRPLRPQPLQVGKLLAQVNPLLTPTVTEAQESPAQEGMPPAFSNEDAVFLKRIGVSLDFNFDPGIPF